MNRSNRFNSWVQYALLWLWSGIVIGPLLWALTTSFKTEQGVARGATYLPWLQYRPSLRGWQDLFNTTGVSIAGPYLNTAIVAVGSTALAISLATLAAYGLTRFEYRFGPMRNADISFFFISQWIIPPVVLTLPYFILLRDLGLLDSLFGLMLVYLGILLPIAVWVLSDYFANIPRELDEAAMVDGASRLTVFIRIVLPIATPGIVVAALLCFIFAWNEYLFALVLTFTNSQTLPVAVAALNSQQVPWWSLSASTLIAVVPLVFIAVALERYMVKGALVGSLK